MADNIDFSPTFTALLNEAAFTHEMLTSGVEQLRRTNYARKGTYFQAFSSLTVGLERIGKLCIILDYYLENSGSFPDDDYMRRIGHDLNKIYSASQIISSRRSIRFKWLNDLDLDIYRTIIDILGRFAKGDRYANIDLLVNSKRLSDPIAEWNSKIDSVLWETRVSIHKKKEIEDNARTIDEMTKGIASVLFISEDGSSISNAYQASFETGRIEAIINYRQVVVCEIVRYWVELLSEIGYKCQMMGRQDIPFFLEMFAIFYNPSSLLLDRRVFSDVADE